MPIVFKCRKNKGPFNTRKHSQWHSSGQEPTCGCLVPRPKRGTYYYYFAKWTFYQTAF